MAPGPVRLSSPAAQLRFDKWVRASGATSFNAELGLLYLATPTPEHHANLPPGQPVHPTRDTLYLARDILKSDEPALHPIALMLIERLLPMQDADPSSRTFGTWPRAHELPLSTDPKPDLNWTVFFAEALLDLRLGFVDRIPPRLRAAIDRAAGIAARAVLSRTGRHADPGYTNVAVKSAVVANLAARLSDDADLKTRALEKLRAIVAHARHHGDFTEYNSPTYAWVSVKALHTLCRHATDSEVLALAGELLQLTWEGIALHHHAPTGQWAGPCSRAYFDLLAPAGDIGGALARALRAPPDEFSVPPNLRPLFSELPEPRLVVRSHYRVDTPPRPALVNGELLGIAPLVTTTFLAPHFAVGSVSLGDFWWQRRPLLAHWGSRENPSYLRLRFLSDGRDFQAPVIASVQTAGRVLSAISFPTDGALHHYDALPDGRLATASLRLRFEFGGAGRAFALPAPAAPCAPVHIDLGACRLALRLAHLEWNVDSPRWETGAGDHAAWLDLVLRDGAPTEIDFLRLKTALLVLALEFSDASDNNTSFSRPPPVVTIDGPDAEIAWDGLSLCAPRNPTSKETLLRRYRLGPAQTLPS